MFTVRFKKIYFVLVVVAFICVTLHVCFIASRQGDDTIYENKYSDKESLKHGLKVRSLIRSVFVKSFQIQQLLNHDMNKLAEKNKDLVQRLVNWDRLLVPLENSLINEMTLLNNEDEEGDRYKLRELNRRAQHLIQHTQNQKNCRRAKKLFCNVEAKCGFGCLVHHYGVCLFLAIGTNRVMQWDLKAITDYPGLDEVFMPLSETCNNITGGKEAPEWYSEKSSNPTPVDTEVVKVTLIDSHDRQTPFAPMTIPEEFYPLVKPIHGDPLVWWAGQVQSYLMRPKAWVTREVQIIKQDIGFKHPVVGVHIRRTDKSNEANFQRMEAYMDPVANWYDKYVINNDVTNITKLVYVATDDLNYMQMLQNVYPEFTFITNQQSTRHADTSLRLSRDGLKGIVTDVHLLVECDHFVGTFSSNIGRLVYEMKQQYDSDPTFTTTNIDHAYRYWGQPIRVHEAIMNHNPTRDECQRAFMQMSPTYLSQMEDMCEIELKIGDKIEVWPEIFHGYKSGGRNFRTQKFGAYPMFKVKEVIKTAPYPSF
uniref:alpha-(1,6)-fucosyltransferase-like isoform X1 n=1 Tax=Ciona intestinalis TaxID=7719 RepID=UPI00089DBE22|nr:alpha-(1,6)-fucosyltransferase-like isoform X1 [Ciona intestinalis]|eukprot:XP_018667645.1 alpha-(1,6)-fucosyltransferase-like isoform X1 [Ciona intestinalis]